jgi:hypothetical protein
MSEPDRRAMIPFANLDLAPWNPKIPLEGAYKDGLAASMDHFGVRDDLKVWPNPREPGRYFVLDGNQRFTILKAKGKDSIECRILADLDDEDAKLFTAAFNRNVARYDEAKLADLAASCSKMGAELKDRLLRVGRITTTAPVVAPEFFPATARTRTKSPSRWHRQKATACRSSSL